MSAPNQAGLHRSDGVPKAEEGKLVENVVHFVRALRNAGLPADPGRTVDAVKAIELTGLESQEDLHWVLHACLVTRPEHRETFGEVFRLFWRDPRYLEHMMAMLVPSIRATGEDRKPASAARRAVEALTATLDNVDLPEVAGSTVELAVDARGTSTSGEKLGEVDFEQMTAAEVAEANCLIAELVLPARPIIARRYRPDPRGRRPNWRKTMRKCARSGGEVRAFSRERSRMRDPNLIVLCDISGSMSAYSRTILRFIHGVSNRTGAGWRQVSAFTFGTRLTNISRHMHQKDPDTALAAVGKGAKDWEGGTRIGSCLRDFNRQWIRRLKTRDSVVLLVSDGLESGDANMLAHEIAMLKRSVRRLIWINPLLRWDGFAPRAAGIKAMMPHVDCFRAAHNIDSLKALCDAVCKADDEGEKARMLGLIRQHRQES